MKLVVFTRVGGDGKSIGPMAIDPKVVRTVSDVVIGDVRYTQLESQGAMFFVGETFDETVEALNAELTAPTMRLPKPEDVAAVVNAGMAAFHTGPGYGGPGVVPGDLNPEIPFPPRTVGETLVAQRAPAPPPESTAAPAAKAPPPPSPASRWGRRGHTT